MEKRSGPSPENKNMTKGPYQPQMYQRNRRRQAVQACLCVPRSYLSICFVIIVLLATSLIVVSWYLNQRHSIEEHCIEPGAVSAVSIRNVSDSNLTVTWDDSGLSNATVVGYSVALEDEDGLLVKRVSTHHNKYIFTQLHPWTVYHADISAYNVMEDCTRPILYGPKIHASARTSPKAPSVPNEVQIDETTNDTVVISWDKPHIPNGPIDGYVIRNVNAFPKQEVTTVQLNYTVRGLKPWTKYRFSVSAFNKFKGFSLTGPEVILDAQTTVATPGPLSRPQIGPVTNTSVQVVWEAPKVPNGPIDGYIVKLLGIAPVKEATVKATSHIFNNLNPWTSYTFSVTPFNLLKETRLIGPSANVTGRTAGLPPPYPVKSLSVVNSDQSSASLTIPNDLFSNANGPVVEFVLLVAQSEYEAHVHQKGYEGPDKAHLLSWAEAQGTDHWYRSSPKNWIYRNDNRNCKYWNEESRVCRIGLDRSCSWNDKHCNGPLRPNTKYWVKIRAYTEFGWSESFPVPFTTEPEVIKKEEPYRPVSYPSHKVAGPNAADRTSSGLILFVMSLLLLFII